MLAAAIGATVAMMIIMLINWRYQKDFWKEWRASFRLRRDDQPLGEVKLREMLQGESK
jgi:hypothetical protein